MSDTIINNNNNTNNEIMCINLCMCSFFLVLFIARLTHSPKHCQTIYKQQAIPRQIYIAMHLFLRKERMERLDVESCLEKCTNE